MDFYEFMDDYKMDRNINERGFLYKNDIKMLQEYGSYDGYENEFVEIVIKKKPGYFGLNCKKVFIFIRSKEKEKKINIYDGEKLHINYAVDDSVIYNIDHRRLILPKTKRYILSYNGQLIKKCFVNNNFRNYVNVYMMNLYHEKFIK